MVPYEKRGELPEPIKEHLPIGAQNIYKETFNNAWAGFVDPARLKYGGDRESASHRVAWFAVKKSYVKNRQGKWVRKKK